MMILAIEFSSPTRSVALLRRTGQQPAELLGMVSDEGARTVKPLRLVDQLLTKTEVRRDEVDTLVLGLGPGSYTGIRSSIALAQGWQLARGVKLTGLNTVECLAFQAQARGWFGRVSVVIDAQRNEVYLATYLLASDRRELVEPLRLVKLDDLSAAAAQHDLILIGPEISKWSVNGRVLCPEAGSLGLLLPAEFQPIPGEQLEPIYLRETAFVKAPPGRVLPQ